MKKKRSVGLDEFLLPVILMWTTCGCAHSGGGGLLNLFLWVSADALGSARFPQCKMERVWIPEAFS